VATGHRYSRGSGRTYPARQKLRKFWELGPGGDDIASLDVVQVTTSTTVLLGAGVTPTGQNLTIIRTHGFLEFQLQAADAATTGFSMAAGIGIVSADAFAAGVGSVPDPFDDIGWPGWLWHQMGALHSPITIASQVSPSDNQVWTIDSKAMRKLGLNEVAFLSCQVGESAAATMTVRGATRMLLAVGLGG